MLGKTALLMLLVFVISGEISRKDAKAQRELSGLFAPLRLCARILPAQSEELAVEDAFEAYAKGDYSVVPVVLRVANQVDSRPEDF